MRARTVLGGVLLSASALAMTWGAVSAAAASSVNPTPSATGSSQVSFTVEDTSSPTPTPSSSGGGSGGGSGGHGGSGGGTGGGGTEPPACVPSTKTPPLAPSPRASPAPLRLSTHRVSQGADVLVTADGFQPGEKIVIALYSNPVKLGTFTVRTNGQVYAQVTIPKRTQLGSHTIQVIGFADCLAAASTIDIVSPRGSGTSIFPWIVWIVAGGGVALAGIGILIAYLLGWLPRGLAIAVATRAVP